MTHAVFTAYRVAIAAEARVAEIVKFNERRDAQSERVQRLLAIASAGPVGGVMTLGIDDFSLLARHFPAAEDAANG